MITAISKDVGPPSGGATAVGQMIDDYASRVLDVVDSIPPGRVMSYGDIAEYLGVGGPRQVGRVLARYGGGVPWWRVIRADGTPPQGHESLALPHYLAEGTPLRSAPNIPSGGPVRVDMRAARWAGVR
jgi:alkylated DNA nucleotide flippase Atl1